jgi:hypothetical protein
MGNTCMSHSNLAGREKHNRVKDPLGFGKLFEFASKKEKKP